MKTLTLTIDGFDYNARGVARHDGKTVFVSGALPGERVVARITADKKRFLETDVVQILEPSPARITPACAYYDDCGGCALQHASDAAQHRLKETVWLEQLARIGGVRPQTVLPAISGADWHYRALCAALARSADARAERARQHAYLARKNRIEGLPNPPADSLEARLAQHHINGDISAAQLVAITRLLPR